MPDYQVPVTFPQFLEPDGLPICTGQSDDGTYITFKVRMRPIWTWPKWLTARWIFRNPRGEWWGTDIEPVLKVEALKMPGYWEHRGRLIDLSMTNFYPPPCSNWKESKFKNPYLLVSIP